MKQLIHVSSLLLIGAILTIGCSTNSITDELLDGKFTASVENQSKFDGDASFKISIPSSELSPDSYEVSVLSLLLKTGEISFTREFNNELTEYTIYIGLSLNTFWQENSSELDLGLSMYKSTFIQPGSLTKYAIKTGTIKIDEKSEDLIAGNFDLVAANSLGAEINITGKFRAIHSE